MQQGDLLIEKTLNKSPPHLPAGLEVISENGASYDEGQNVLGLSNVLGNANCAETQEKLKVVDGISTVEVSGPEQSVNGASGLSNINLGSSLHLSQSYPETNHHMIPGSLSCSPSSLWSTSSVDDSFLSNMQGLNVNGGSYQNPVLSYSQIPSPNPNGMIGAQFSMTQHNPPSRRAITGSHNMLPNSIHSQYPANKGYPSWSTLNSPQQNGWASGMPAQHNLPGIPGWNRGRQASSLSPQSHLPPITATMPPNMSNMNRKFSPSFNQGVGGMAPSPNKFKRSTSYPGKGPFGPKMPECDLLSTEEKDMLSFQVSGNRWS